MSLARLISMGSDPFIEGVEVRAADVGSTALHGLLRRRDGFFAFEQSLLVLPSQGAGAIPSVSAWNQSSGWRASYPELPATALCFAMDVFCGQFALVGERVFRLEPETGELGLHAEDLEGWAARILSDYDFELGWSVGRAWQVARRPLRPNERLLPRRPFVLGGDYSVENLVAVELNAAMTMLGSLAEQIRGAPDGRQVTVEGWGPEWS